MKAFKSPFSFADHYPLDTIALILLVILALAGVWTLGGIQKEVNGRLAQSLETVLNTAHQALQGWVEQTEVDVSVLAESDEFRTYTEAQLRVPRTRAALLKTAALQKIRGFLAPAMRAHRLTGFSVIAPDGIQIASAYDEYVGLREIVDSNPTLLDRVMRGENFLGLPLQPRTVVQQTTFRGRPDMTVSAPMRNAQGTVIAVLTVRVDPSGEFTETTRLGRLGQTGETYAFDREARLLTASRFSLGRTGSARHQILSTEIRDPAGDTTRGFEPATSLHQQPLTRMAALERVNDRWKLATRSELERWEGVAGCAIEQS